METLPNTTEDAFLTTLQTKLLDQSGLISSAQGSLETTINKAIEGVKTGQEATKSRLESAYEREKGYLSESNTAALTAAKERGAGMMTTDVAYRSMAAEADKQIKDLTMRKDELILQGDAQAAAKISELITKSYELKVNGLQTTFNNLTSMANFGLASLSEKRAQRAQLQQEKESIGQIALQYGLSVKPGDTIDSIISRAAPMASEEQKLRLAKIQADIRSSNAQARKAESDLNSGKYDPTMNNYYTEWAASNWAEFASAAANAKMPPDQIAKYRNLGSEKQASDFEKEAYDRMISGEDPEAVVGYYVGSATGPAKVGSIMPSKTAEAILKAKSAYEAELERSRPAREKAAMARLRSGLGLDAKSDSFIGALFGDYYSK